MPIERPAPEQERAEFIKQIKLRLKDSPHLKLLEGIAKEGNHSTARSLQEVLEAKIDNIQARQRQAYLQQELIRIHESTKDELYASLKMHKEALDHLNLAFRLEKKMGFKREQ